MEGIVTGGKTAATKFQGKTIRATAAGGGGPPHLPGLVTGFSRPRVAGSMACYLRVISRVQVSGTVTSRAKQPGGERGQLSGSPFEQKVGSVLGENPPDLAATPADTAINPSSPPFARSPKYPGIRRRRRHHPGAGGRIRHLGIIRSPASACQ